MAGHLTVTLILSAIKFAQSSLLLLATATSYSVAEVGATYQSKSEQATPVTQEEYSVDVTNYDANQGDFTHPVQPIINEPVINLQARSMDEQQVIDKILQKLPPIMVEVARCESGLNPEANRKNIDRGLFQINQVHNEALEESGLDPLNIDDNIEYTVRLYESSGLGPWYMSEHCWGHLAYR